MNPLVTIIVPSYNHARYLEQRLNSIFTQTFSDYEVILLDDCSTDSSPEILNAFSNNPRVSCYIRNETNGGSVFKQWNLGVSLAKGEYIWIAESDDASSPQFLETLVTILIENPSVPLAFCQSILIDSRGAQIGRHAPRYFKHKQWDANFYASKELCRSFFSKENVIPNASSVLFRKSAYVSNGWGNACFGMAGDWWTWMHMSENGGLYFCAEPLNYYRHHSQSVRVSTIQDNVQKHYSDLLRIANYCKNEWGRSPAKIISNANILYSYRMLIIHHGNIVRAKPMQTDWLSYLRALVSIALNFFSGKLCRYNRPD
jgi:glycosyltransferase involved in cell wall biosynthesis